MRVGIVGGGILGVTLGYFLSQSGAHVDIYEAGPDIGGLAGPMKLSDGTEVDRFYHAILSSDRHLRELCAELGLADQMRFKQTRMGFYVADGEECGGRIYSMNSSVELLRFPLLTWVDRFRLGLTVLAAQLNRNPAALDEISVEDWLIRYGGRHAYEALWRPMLKAKFDGGFDQVPATWIWSRLVRMKSTRSGVDQKEEAGHITGGYNRHLHAMVERIEATGGAVHLQTRVQEITIEQGATRGLRFQDQFVPFDAVVSTMQTPLFSRLIPDAPAAYRERMLAQQYLGILCPVLVTDRPLSGYWTLNITDDSVPFTGIIETTTYIDTQYTGGNHLVYLPKYTAPGSPWQEKSDDEIRVLWLDELRRMFPEFPISAVRELIVNRHRFVEPLHGLGGGSRIPPIETPIRNLYLATTSQIYPALTNGESVTRQARQAADQVLGVPAPVASLAVAEPVPAVA